MGLFDYMQDRFDSGESPDLEKRVRDFDMKGTINMMVFALLVMNTEDRVGSICAFLKAVQMEAVDIASSLVEESIKRADMTEIDRVVDRSRVLLELMEFTSHMRTLLERAAEPSDVGEYGVFTSNKQKMDEVVEETRAHLITNISKRIVAEKRRRR